MYFHSPPHPQYSVWLYEAQKGEDMGVWFLIK
uniref:Uncharacterized protein n=1 Tax=Anguilla anguilla TaxID=7936 RepID=A0A0E9XIC4_ANGAN